MINKIKLYFPLFCWILLACLVINLFGCFMFSQAEKEQAIRDKQNIEWANQK